MSDTDNLFDYAESVQRRDAGMERVAMTRSQLMAAARREAAIWCKAHRGRTVIGEDIRRAVIERGINLHHANAWGPLTKWLIDNRYLRPTGRIAPMTAKRSHARLSPEYEIRW